MIWLVMAGCACASATHSTGQDFLAIPLSGRAEPAGAYAASGPLLVAANPALLTSQSAPWEVEATGRFLFDGAERYWAAALGWRGATALAQDTGIGLYAAVLSADPIQVLDAEGYATGEDLTAGSRRVGTAFAMGWDRLSIGAGVSAASSDLSGAREPLDSISAATCVDAGACWGEGKWRLGVAGSVRAGDTPDVLSVGGAAKVSDRIVLGLESRSGFPAVSGGSDWSLGLAWRLHSVMDIRLGAAFRGSAIARSVTGRGGFTFHWRNLSLDYGFDAAPFSGGSASHIFGLGWALRARRAGPPG